MPALMSRHVEFLENKLLNL